MADVSAETPVRTANATAAHIRKAQERKAAKLRDAGWHVTPPERHPQKAAPMTDDDPNAVRDALTFMHAVSGLTDTPPNFNLDEMHGLQGVPNAGLKSIKEALDQGYRVIIEAVDVDTAALTITLEPPDEVDTLDTTPPLVLT